MMINVYRSSRISNRYFCQILIKGVFSQRIFGKYSHIKYHENPSNGSRVVPLERMDRQTGRQADRQTDRHDEANSRFS
jgi:hypothetical protein